MFPPFRRVVCQLLTVIGFLGCGGTHAARPRDSGADNPATVYEVHAVLDGPAALEGGDHGPEAAGQDGLGELRDGARAVVDTAADVGREQVADAVDDTPVDGDDGARDAPLDVVPAILVDANAAEAASNEAGSSVPPECSDNDPCTVDRFDGIACTHISVADGTPCSDGNLCTLGDRCQSGVCIAGATSHGSLTELARLDSFGTEAGIVVPTRDGRIVFVDPASPMTVIHTVSIANDVLTVLGADYPRVDQPLAGMVSKALNTGWPGYVASAGGDDDWTVSLATVDESGKPSLHPSFHLPFDGNLNGLAGYQKTLWVCENLPGTGPPFGGTGAGSIFLYDLSDPDAPTLVQTIMKNGLTCGSLAVSADGKRVYFNTGDGIYWFDPSVTNTYGYVVNNGPFGANSGLTMVGSTLVARGASSVVLYNESDQTKWLEIDQSGLLGAAYIPSQQALVLMKYEQTNGTYQRRLQLRDASPSGEGAVLDEVLLDTSSIAAGRIPSNDDIVFDVRSKAAFRVSNGKLKRLSLPMLGGNAVFAPDAHSLGAWSPTAWRSIDVSDPAHPAWMQPGGPVIGRSRGIGLDIGSAAPVLVDDPSDLYWPMPPQLGRVGVGSSQQSTGPLGLALRDGKSWSQSTDLGTLLLDGNEWSTLQWSSESLFAMESWQAQQIRMRRWDRALLVPSGLPVSPREDRVFVLADLPADVGIGLTMDFPEHSDVGLIVAHHTVEYDVYAADFLWIDRSTTSMRVIDQVSLSSLTSVFTDCRVSGLRTVCLTGDEMILVERGAESGNATIKRLPLDPAAGAILAFDGSTFYLSRANALAAVSFDRAVHTDAVDGGLANVPTIPFSYYPLAIAEMPGVLVVASQYEVVTLVPECAGR